MIPLLFFFFFFFSSRRRHTRCYRDWSSDVCSSDLDGAPEGSYQCSGNTGISVCKKGSWEYATSCTCTIYDGDPRKPPYPSRCATNFDVANSVGCRSEEHTSELQSR